MVSDISVPFSCILLAAGASRRLGEPKQLVCLDGEALVQRAARILLDLGAAEVIVVTGHESSKILKKIEDIPVKAVQNIRWDDGMGSSLAVGASHLSGQSAGVLVLLCDQWKVDAVDLNSLLDRWVSDISGLFCAQWAGSETPAFGPPAIFPNSLFSELKMLGGDRGARRLIEKYRNRLTFVPMENAAFDLDEPADLVRMRLAAS